MDSAQIVGNIKQDDEGLFCFNAKPLNIGGAIMLPACQWFGGCLEQDTSLTVMLALSAKSIIGNTLTIGLQMTPEGARQMASALLAEAQKVEAHVVEQAAAAIEAARKGGAA